MNKILLATAILFGALLPLKAANISYAGSAFNGVIASSKTIDIDLNAKNIDSAVVQVIYSTASPSTVTFKDGTVAVASLTVVSLTGLTTAYATNSIWISSNSALVGSTLWVNGYPMKEGNAWTCDVNYASNTLVSLNAALNNNFGSLFASTYNVTTNGNKVIYSTSASYGSASNTFAIYSSTPAALSSSSTFTGGSDNAYVSINGYKLQANVDFWPQATTAQTASTIAVVMTNKAPFSSMLISTGNAVGTALNVVFTTTTVTGVNANYSLYSSSPSVLQWNVTRMINGTDSDIVGSTLNPVYQTPSYGEGYSYVSPRSANTIYKTQTQWGTALPVLFAKSGTAGTTPGGMVTGTTYYVTNVTATSFQLSTTVALANSGWAMPYSTIYSSGGFTATITPLAFVGYSVMTLQESNDGTNFQSLYLVPSTSAVTTPALAQTTQTAAGAASNVIWGIPQANFKYLRLNFVPGTAGGTNVNYVINGKGSIRNILNP
jgi:hypothetical protein